MVGRSGGRCRLREEAQRSAWVVAVMTVATVCVARAGSGVVTPLPGPAAAPSRAAVFGETLDADDLVREVLARNPTLAAMKAAARAARERHPQVTALEDPHAGTILGPATIGNRRVDTAWKIELSQALPWPGKLSTRGETALREAEAADEDVETSRLGLVEATRETFYDWWTVHRETAINDTTLDLLAEIRAIAEARYAAGLASKQEALQVELEHERLVHRAVVLERMREVSRTQLNTLLNRPPKEPIPAPPPVLTPPRALPPRERLEAEALERRPALHAERRRIEARRADVRLAELEYFPDLVVTGAYDAFWETAELRPMVGIGINVPLQLGRRRAALDEARARLRQAEALLEEKKAQVLFEVNRANDEIREHAHAVHLYAGSIIPAAEESFASARSGYESATNDFRTLIEAERTLLETRLAHERGLAGYHKALARLERAVGVAPEEMEDLR